MNKTLFLFFLFVLAVGAADARPSDVDTPASSSGLGLLAVTPLVNRSGSPDFMFFDASTTTVAYGISAALTSMACYLEQHPMNVSFFLITTDDNTTSADRTSAVEPVGARDRGSKVSTRDYACPFDKSFPFGPQALLIGLQRYCGAAGYTMRRLGSNVSQSLTPSAAECWFQFSSDSPMVSCSDDVTCVLAMEKLKTHYGAAWIGLDPPCSRVSGHYC